MEKAISIWESKDFFFELEPLPGAVEAVKQMANLQNTDVFICTSPIKMFKYCPYEKYAWVEKHFGPDFLEQIVLTRDKTVISADLLIDDRPDITGAEPHPSWEHILFTSCHNYHLQLQPLAAGCTHGQTTGRPSWTASGSAEDCTMALSWFSMGLTAHNWTAGSPLRVMLQFPGTSWRTPVNTLVKTTSDTLPFFP